MKRLLQLLVLGCAYAFATAHAADLKIGVVNVAKLLESSPQAERSGRELEREFKPRYDRLVTQQNEVKRLEERLAKEGATMSKTQAQQLERDILDKRRELKRAQDEFREDSSLRRNEALGKVQKEILEAIDALAREQGFDLILSDVVFAKPGLDVTNKVQAKLGAGGSRAK